MLAHPLPLFLFSILDFEYLLDSYLDLPTKKAAERIIKVCKLAMIRTYRCNNQCFSLLSLINT
jgi:hypothetical protein